MRAESTATGDEGPVLRDEPPMASPASHDPSASKAPVPSCEDPVPSTDPKSEYSDPNPVSEMELGTKLEPVSGDVAAAVVVEDSVMVVGLSQVDF